MMNPLKSLLNMIPLYGLKIILQLLLTVLNMVCWIIPLRNKKFSQNTTILSLANSFAGGIFLMLAFGHLLPHSIEVLDSVHIDRSVAFNFCLVGYLLVFFIEKIAFNSHALLHEAGNNHKDNSPPSTPKVLANIHDHDHSHGHDHDENCNHNDNSIVKGTMSPKSAIVLLLAMSCHSLFETMALGIATDKTSALMMAASIGLHQPAESIALLVAFLKTSLTVPQIMKWLALFSCVGPLGVGLGVLISKIATPYMDAVIVAITAGTFLYVGATEVVNEEFEDVHGKEKWLRFAALLSGMGMISMVSNASAGWEGGHDHSHSHKHPDL